MEGLVLGPRARLAGALAKDTTDSVESVTRALWSSQVLIGKLSGFLLCTTAVVSVADAAGVEGPVRIFRPAEYGNSHPEPALYVGCFQDTEGDAFEQHEQVVDTFCE